MRAPTLAAAAACLVAAAAARAQSPIGTRLDSVMRVAESNGFSGVVRMQQGGDVLLERGYGLANRARRVPFTPATVVQIGSNTKDFTAVAVLQLHARGRLSLDDSLARFFPQPPADKRAITVRQLLAHRAGFPLGIGGDFVPVTRAQLVDSAMRTRLLFVPGARASYSNTGYSLLAAIVEQVTGQTYDAYVRDAILAPLGLRRTGFLLPAYGPDDVAHGYLAGGTDQGTMLARPHASDGPWWNLRGNGGMLSTVGDMQRFYTALFESETLLPAAVRALQFDASAPMGLAGSDGVEFFLYERVPPARLELIVASTNAAMKAPAIRRALATVLGLPSVDGPDGERLARRPGGMPAPAPVAVLLRGFVDAVNANDTTALRRWVGEHFTTGPGAPTLDERMQRLGGVHERLGAIAVERIEAFPDGPVEMAVKSAIDGAGVIRFDVEPGDPPKIRRLAISLGG